MGDQIGDEPDGECVKQKRRNETRNYNDNESSSEDDEDAEDLKHDKIFFQILEFLITEDADKGKKVRNLFLDPSTVPQNSKNKENKCFDLGDNEKNLIVKKDGNLEDNVEMPEKESVSSSPVYDGEQQASEDNFILESSNTDGLESSNADEEKNKFISLLKEMKSKAELQKKQGKGGGKRTASELKPSDIPNNWTSMQKIKEEAFLKNYIMKYITLHKYLDPENMDFQPAYNEVVHDSCDLDIDMKYMDLMEKHEHKYNNFSFEDPDEEFMKQYPRCIEAAKRRKEIWAKINKIKKIAGNDGINFQDDDFEEDFDPEKHDHKMSVLFNDDYYQIQEEQKPKCPELERDLEIENWENWRRKDVRGKQKNKNTGENTQALPESEVPVINMSCSDDHTQLQNELISMMESKRKESFSGFAAVLAKEKPIFDPKHKTFEDYIDEYYKLDYEDIIDDLPCRFKYRRTTPNDYGLTVDEILRADNKELNKWCSLKRILQYKPKDVEKHELKIYQKKAKNEILKRKILSSLYFSNPDDNMQKNKIVGMKGGKRKKKKTKNIKIFNGAPERNEIEDAVEVSRDGKNKNKKRKLKENEGVNEKSLKTKSGDENMTKKKKRIDEESDLKISGSVDCLMEDENHSNKFKNKKLASNTCMLETSPNKTTPKISPKRTFIKNSDVIVNWNVREIWCNGTYRKPPKISRKGNDYFFGTLSITSVTHSEILKQLIDFLDEYDISLLALQEFKCTDDCPVESEEYMIFKGKSRCNPLRNKILGTAFIVHRKLKNSVRQFYSPNERLSLITLLYGNNFYTLINCHAPSDKDNMNKQEEVENFWEILQEEMSKIPRNNVKILLGNFNAQLGKEREYKPVVGCFPAHFVTDRNGERLIELCRHFSMKIMTTHFLRLPKQKYTRTFPYSYVELQVDHVAISYENINEMQNITVQKLTNIRTFHHLSIIKMRYMPQEMNSESESEIKLT